MNVFYILAFWRVYIFDRGTFLTTIRAIEWIFNTCQNKKTKSSYMTVQSVRYVRLLLHRTTIERKRERERTIQLR